MMQARKTNPRAEHRLRRSARVEASPSLAEVFPKLKALTVNVEFFDPSGNTRAGGMKYKPNLEKAKSAMCFDCPSGECVGGDYEVSQELRRAIAAKKTVVSGELKCQGMRHKPKQEPIKCQNLLRYELRLSYQKGR